MQFSDLFDEVPIVAAVKSENELSASLMCDSNVVFLLFGDICNIPQLVKEIKDSGKLAIVHIDLIEGLAAREVGVDFIKEHTEADGIISTKAGLIRYAKTLGLITIRRFFLLDSLALDTISKQSALADADAFEVLPGVMPKIISHIVSECDKPIIAGGLIRDKDDVVNAVSAGAIAVSSTNSKVWFL